ncbi:MAG: tyrosine--tRNA ligase [Planctomycetota bacterium]|nr:tyrosine--tRNA ligase [Planctomycetota bacterium]
MPSVEEQLRAISRGTVDILPEGSLQKKLEKSISESRPLRVKLGVDPTAPDIHLGHTVVLRKLRAFQDLGHQAVLIIGDYTALIGDPSGKSKTRPQLTEEEVETNAETYLKQVESILDTDKLEIVHNGDFFRDMTFADILKLTSRMTISQLLARDDFSKRYKEQSPISLHEFLYPLMQGWDSVEVRADVELGGTDQTFNLLVGREMQKEEGMSSQVCITLPLLIGLDGTNKMSKSLGNYIGVDEDANEMYGKAMSIPDELMKDYFTLLTNTETAEIDSLLSGHPRDAKDRLGRVIVTQYHNAEAAEAAAERFKEIFAQKQVPDDMPALSLSSDDLEDGNIWIVKLVNAAGFASSNGEARRLVQQGGVSIDGEAIKDPAAQVAPADGAVLKVGKRRFAKIVLG